MNRIYIIDTNILMHQIGFHKKLGVAQIVIPNRAIIELNGLKKNDLPETNIKARKALAWIEEISQKGNLPAGIQLSNGAIVQTVAEYKSGNYSNERGDNEILGTAIFVAEESPDKEIVLLTNDIGFLDLARINLPANGRACHFSATSTLHFNHYDILGVKENASKDEIERAYKTLIRKYHPDGHAGCAPEVMASYTAMAQEITAAFTVLKTPSARERYDQREFLEWKQQFHAREENGQADAGAGASCGAGENASRRTSEKDFKTWRRSIPKPPKPKQSAKVYFGGGVGLPKWVFISTILLFMAAEFVTYKTTPINAEPNKGVHILEKSPEFHRLLHKMEYEIKKGNYHNYDAFGRAENIGNEIDKLSSSLGAGDAYMKLPEFNRAYNALERKETEAYKVLYKKRKRKKTKDLKGGRYGEKIPKDALKSDRKNQGDDGVIRLSPSQSRAFLKSWGIK